MRGAERSIAVALIACALLSVGGVSFAQEAPAPTATPAPTNAPSPTPANAPRYLEAIRNELRALGARADCSARSATRAECSMSVTLSGSERSFDLRLTYSDETDTIYMFIPRYLVAAPTAPTTPSVLRRLMELNWELLLGKLEWNSSDGEVRLAMVLNTDSNFDRRTFRSAFRSLVSTADRLFRELHGASNALP